MVRSSRPRSGRLHPIFTTVPMTYLLETFVPVLIGAALIALWPWSRRCGRWGREARQRTSLDAR